jgi:hypothetical protein
MIWNNFEGKLQIETDNESFTQTTNKHKRNVSTFLINYFSGVFMYANISSLRETTMSDNDDSNDDKGPEKMSQNESF